MVSSENINKFNKVIQTLRPNTEMIWNDDIINETDFNQVKWVTGKNDNGEAITSDTNPHSELTWDLVKAEMDKVKTEYDALDYARKREAEYPSVQDLVVALYDTDDKAAIDEKRAAVKLKYLKP